MAKQIIWTIRAKTRYLNILEYLKDNWSDHVLDSFIEKVDALMIKLSSGTIIFKSTKKLHEVLITKHNLLVYKIQKDQIIIVAIYDTRQHPKKKLKK